MPQLVSSRSCRLDQGAAERRGCRHDAAASPRCPSRTRAITAADVACAAQLACLLEVSAPEARERVAGPPFRRCALRGLPRQRGRDSASRLPAPARAASAQRCGWPSRPRRDGRARTRTSASSCCWRPSRARRSLEKVGLPAAPWAKGTAPTPPSSPRVAPSVRVLDATTVDDAREAYAAIRLAAPGGLGTAPMRRTSRTSRR